MHHRLALLAQQITRTGIVLLALCGALSTRGQDAVAFRRSVGAGISASATAAVVQAGDVDVRGQIGMPGSSSAAGIQGRGDSSDVRSLSVVADPAQFRDERMSAGGGVGRDPVDLLAKGKQALDSTSAWLTPATETYDKKAGNHFEAGATARLIFGKRSPYPVTIMLPAYMAVDDVPWYNSGRYGYVTGAIQVRVPLAFIPDRYGKWSAGPTAEICYYGSTASEFMSSMNLEKPKIGAAVNVEL